ncbi:MAG TPA: spore germination protein, partial [Clostridia bacterium]
MFKKTQKDAANKIETKAEPTKQKRTENIVKSIELNIELFKRIFKNDETLVVRELENKWLKSAQCCIIYLNGMINTEIVNESIIFPILNNDLSEKINNGNLLEELGRKVIASNKVSIESDINVIIDSLAYGDTIFLLNGYDKVLIIDSKGWQTRPISEPESAKVVRGPREGFTESILINISLIRKRIKSPDLKIKFKEIGTRTHTKTCICYIEGLALEEIIKELESRLDKIDIDGIIDSGYIQELIRDAPFSPFETVGHSERPDVIAAKLLEGRVALIVDGSPFVLTVPFIIVENTQSNEDYYNNYIFSSINRFIRSTATITSVSIPALYLAIVTYHQEML